VPTESKKLNKRLIVYILILIGIASIIFASTIGFNIFRKVSHRPPPIPRQTNVELIQDWMTVPFIAKSYHVPEPLLFQKLGVNSQEFRRSNLSTIAQKTGKNMTDVIQIIRQTISELQSSPPQVKSP
jgi:hypothetical protein